MAVVDASHNPFLGAFLTPLTRIIEQSMSESWRDPQARHSGLMAHSAICNAIVNRQEDEAGQAMLNHLEDSKQRLASVLVLPLSRHVATGQADTSTQTDPLEQRENPLEQQEKVQG
jgi:hypothetical protein